MKQKTSCLKAPGILFLLLFLFSISAFGQTITVKGTVVDVTKATLPGVNVKVQGTNTGTITDVDGKFSVQVSPKAKLVLSYVGYTSQIVSVDGRTVINVTLAEDTKVLSEVVAIGYGTAKKSDVTGSIASINEKSLKEVPVANVAQSMQGRIAGVQIDQTSTRPGGDSQIRIRGSRSLNASNDPLIIVDGIPFAGSLNDINPGDIKAVDILKDASATAIYGSRGANGVILVTTNRGNYQKTAVTYSGYTGFGNVAKEYQVFNAAEYLTMKSQTGAASWPLLSQETTGQSNGTDTNWQKLIYSTAKIQNHDLSFAGGSENLSGNAGVGYYNESAVMPGQDYTRISVRGALDFKYNDWLKFGLNSRN